MRLVPAILAFTDGDVWRPEIGDPTVMGWVTVFAYFGVMVLCLARVAAARPGRKRAAVLFWSALSVFLFVLGLNKQLDLQTLLTLTGRRLAIAQGWYEYRRIAQLFFVVVVGIGAVGGCVFMSRLVRDAGRDVRIALVGLALLAAFVFVRAASFHHIDILINVQLAGVRMNWVLELGALLIIALGARPGFGHKTAPGDNVGTSTKMAVSP